MRGRAAIAVAVALAAVVAVEPAVAACGGVKTGRPRHVSRQTPLAIGDSVMLGAVPQVAGAGYRVDVRGCRQFGEGLNVIRAYKRAHRLPRLVVVALGTNWVITHHDITRALAIVGPGRVLGLVTPRETGGHGGSDARVIRAAGRRHPHRIVVLDWVRYSAGRSGWFGGDGIHLGPGGAAGLARLLRTALRFSAPAPKPKRPRCASDESVAAHGAHHEPRGDRCARAVQMHAV